MNIGTLLSEVQSALDSNEYLLSSAKVLGDLRIFVTEQYNVANYYNNTDYKNQIDNLNSLLGEYPKCLVPTDACEGEHKDWLTRVNDALVHLTGGVTNKIFPYLPDTVSIVVLGLVAIGIYILVKK